MPLSPKLTTRIVNNIAELGREEWEKVFPRALENYAFFKTLDESAFEQFSFFYIFVYEADTLAGATTGFVMDFPLDIAVNGPLKSVFGLIKKAFPRLFNIRSVFCGLPMGQGRIGIAGDPREVMEAINAGLEKIAGENKAALIFFKDFNRDYDDMLRPCLANGFSRIESFPSTEMALKFSDFDGYLKTLSRASREGLKRSLKKISESAKVGLEVKGALSDQELPEVYGLYLQTYNSQEMGFEKLPPDFFRNISHNMPEETRYFLWRIDGKLAAFALCFVSGDYFVDYYLGFDYAFIPRYNLYYLRFRDLMQWCLANGIRRYEMGATSYEPKRRLGFDFIRLYYYFRHRNRFVNRFLAPLSFLVKPENFDPVFEHLKKA